MSAVLFAPALRLAEPEVTLDESTRLREVNQKLLMLLGHELGSPLTFILAYLRLWQERVAEVDRDELNLVVQQALTLKGRLDDLMLLDQLETGLWRVVLEPISMRALIAQVEEARRAELEEKYLTFVTELDDVAYVQADRDMLFRALDHLVANACKFSPPGGVIRARAERDGTMCRLTVEDHGIGIPPEQHAQIFEPFFQGDLSRARRYNGLGIGLKLVRAIAEKLGGYVKVKSVKGEGSTFIMTVPLAQEPYKQ
jgi:two-component system, OmpR family, phosphate regulon sensor histidine kinase PhoR